MAQSLTGLNPFDRIPQPGYEPFIPGAGQDYGSLSTLGRVEVLGAKRDLMRAAEQKAAADDLLRQTIAQHPDDPEQGILALRRQGFAKEANEWEKHVSEMKKVKLDEARVQMEQARLQGQLDKDAYEREKALLDATSPAQVAKLYTPTMTPEERANTDAYVKWRWGTAGERAVSALPATLEGVAALGMGPEAAGSQALRKKELEQKAAGVSGSTSDFGSFLADYLNGEAEKSGQTPAEMGAKWRADQTVKARTAYSLAQNARTFAPTRQAGTGGTGTTATTAAKMPPQARAVLARVITGMPGTRVGTIQQEVARLADAGDEQALKSYLKYAATQKVGEARQTAMQGRMETLTALKDAEALLRTVPTGLIKGTWENTVRALGQTSDPRLVELGTRMGNILAQYQRSISGAAVTDAEAARLGRLMPNYKQDLTVNLAQLKGFADSIKSFDKAFYENTFGPHYDWVMSGGDAAPASGASSSGTTASGGWVFDAATGKLVKKGGG